MGKIFRLLIIIALAVSAGYAENWENYDLAPGAVPGQNTGGTDPWILLYSWPDMEAQTGDNGMLGIAFDGEFVWVSGRGVTTDNMIYMFEPESGDMVDSFPTGTTSSWGVRDMCFDGTYIYGGQEGGLTCWDITAHYQVSTIPIPAGMAFQRANAYDPATDHFYGGNFGLECYEQDREGNLIRSWSPAPLNAIYGMAWDDDAPDGPWLWVHDQMNPVSGCNVHQMDPVTLTYTGYHVYLSIPPGMNMAGGLDYCQGINPICSSMLVFSQGTPDAGGAFEMYNFVFPEIIFEVELLNAPVQIPANGGEFEMQVTLINTEPEATRLDLWSKVLRPGWYYTNLDLFTVELAPLDSVTRVLTRHVPAYADPGNYYYYTYIGIYPNGILENDQFSFSKLETGDGGEWVEDWKLTEGRSDPSFSVPIPDEITLLSPYPNPFNNQTTIQFSLPTSDNVSLKVFDVQGREVTTLIDGWMNAGNHQAVFDAQLLPSGVYFVRLTVKGKVPAAESRHHSLVRKVMLVK